MKKIFLLMALSFLWGCAPKTAAVPENANSSGCSEQTYEGFPRLEPANRNTFFRCHEGFALNYHPFLRNSLWVAQHLSAENLDDRTATRDKEEFRPDGFLPKGMTPDPSRWTNTGYDRGHLAPADDFRENQVAMSHSFYTSNIVPQDPSHNRGIWRVLEQNVRTWAIEKGDLYVVTGPIFEDFYPTGWLSGSGDKSYVVEEQDLLKKNSEKEKNDTADRTATRKPPPKGSIAIPSQLFKVILDPNQKTAIAFVIPNVPGLDSRNLALYATTVAEVERVTSIRFFPNMAFEAQAALKTQVRPEQWLIDQN